MSENLTIRAVDVTETDWRRYGILYDLTGSDTTGNTNVSAGDNWRDADTDRPLLDTLGSLGRTVGAGCPFACREVERHLHTQEAQIPAGEAICLAVAPPSEEPPAAGDLEAVVVRPGYVLVLHRAVWHSASHPVGGEGAYYWMAQAYENEPTLWAEVQGGPVEVVVP